MSELITSLKKPSPWATSPGGTALWQLGFRPFYLLASSFAALSIPLWAMQYAGWLPRAYLAGPLWRAHEMLVLLVIVLLIVVVLVPLVVLMVAMPIVPVITIS